MMSSSLVKEHRMRCHLGEFTVEVQLHCTLCRDLLAAKKNCNTRGSDVEARWVVFVQAYRS